MNRILFGIIAAFILIAISYFTAKIYGVSFRFLGQTTRITFFTFLLIPFLFAASIIRSRSDAIGSPVVYTTIQVLAGIGLYLFMGALILGVIALIFKITATTLPIWIPCFTLSLSLFFIITGLIQAKYISVQEYTVTLPNAPESWNTKTAVLVTDTHFGLVNYTKFSDKVTNTILSLHPDFVLHGGDFYDGPKIETAPITASWKKLAESVPVFYAPGNHEEYGDYAGFLSSIKNAGVTALVDSTVEYDGVTIAGITYRDGKDNAEATKALDNLALVSTKPTILINHPPTSLAAAEARGIDLQVSGHTHNGQFWPANFIARKVYGAYTHGLAHYKSMSVITSNGVGTFGPPFRLFNSPELVVIRFKTE